MRDITGRSEVIPRKVFRPEIPPPDSGMEKREIPPKAEEKTLTKNLKFELTEYLLGTNAL